MKIIYKFKNINRRINIIYSSINLIFQYFYYSFEKINPLWSKMYGLIANYNGGFLNVLLPTEISLPKWYLKLKYKNCEGIVWIKIGSANKNNKFSQLDFFIDYILPKLKKNIILITSDGDTNIPDDISNEKICAILNSKYVIKWYCQNFNQSNNNNSNINNIKIEPIPIGLDLHFNRGHGIGYSIYNNYIKCYNESQTNTRINKILVDCCINKTSPDREKLCSLLSNNKNFEILDSSISQINLWKKYMQYKYVLSIRGNGFDCHRNWEAIGLGCKVIYVGNELDSLSAKFSITSISPDDLISIDIENLESKFNKNLTRQHEEIINEYIIKFKFKLKEILNETNKNRI